MTTPTDEEAVSAIFPEGGTWTIAVHGWNVTGGVDTFERTVNAMQGFDRGPRAPGFFAQEIRRAYPGGWCATRGTGVR